MKALRLLVPIALGMLSPIPAAHAADPAHAAELDFGDSSSSTLLAKAWGTFGAKDNAGAIAYAEKCIELYQSEALKMQKELKAPATVRDEVVKSWALNDVGTCYLILGQALEAQGKDKKAADAYEFLIKKLSHAQCWDDQGWFWKPAEAAAEKLKAMDSKDDE